MFHANVTDKKGETDILRFALLRFDKVYMPSFIVLRQNSISSPEREARG